MIFSGERGFDAACHIYMRFFSRYAVRMNFYLDFYDGEPLFGAPLRFRSA